MAMHVRFLRDFVWKPKPSATIDYKAGWTGPVPQAAGEAAVAAGAVEVIDEKEAKEPKRSKAAKGE